MSRRPCDDLPKINFRSMISSLQSEILMFPRRVLKLHLFAAPLMLCTVSAKLHCSRRRSSRMDCRSPLRTPNWRPRPL
jgi:hypothetical protein